MPLNIYTHAPSEGANNLAAALGIKKIKRENSNYVGNPNKTVINWGASRLPDAVGRARILNRPEAIAGVSNKLRFFESCLANGAPRIPEFTTDFDIARGWLEGGSVVVARTILNGHSAEGLVIIEPNTGVDIPAAPLYTKYVPKKEEWRVHVLRDGDELTVIDQQRKIKRPDFEGVPNWRVRNHANGFIFARDVAAPHPDVIEQAIKALEVSGLDFGAVDVIWNEQARAAYVLEINTAPGLTGQTVESYANAFRKFL